MHLAVEPSSLRQRGRTNCATQQLLLFARKIISAWIDSLLKRKQTSPLSFPGHTPRGLHVQGEKADLENIFTNSARFNRIYGCGLGRVSMDHMIIASEFVRTWMSLSLLHSKYEQCHVWMLAGFNVLLHLQSGFMAFGPLTSSFWDSGNK